MKRCCTCKQEKPLDQFRKRARSKDGLQDRCAQCAREYYAKNRDRIYPQIIAAQKTRTDVRVQMLFDYLKEHPCVDCGEADPIVLEFDHLPEHDKKASVSSMTSYGIESVRNEIAKCEVVCSNCHSRRTFARSDSWRYKMMRV